MLVLACVAYEWFVRVYYLDVRDDAETFEYIIRRRDCATLWDAIRFVEDMIIPRTFNDGIHFARATSPEDPRAVVIRPEAVIGDREDAAEEEVAEDMAALSMK